uniref:Autophagy-related protein n=1 Tax=Rhizophora mucronata TaxID=61149 RepID=A0A2P2MTF5_RHIMU
MIAFYVIMHAKCAVRLIVIYLISNFVVKEICAFKGNYWNLMSFQFVAAQVKLETLLLCSLLGSLISPFGLMQIFGSS